MSHNSRESNRFFAPICDFDPQLPPNGGREGGNDMIKYFGYIYLVNWPEIIEVYENPLGHFYCLLHTVCVKPFKLTLICREMIKFCKFVRRKSKYVT